MDLFDDLPIAPAPKRAPVVAPQTTEEKVTRSNPAPVAATPTKIISACPRPFRGTLGHRCWVSGGEAYYSWDHGKTWACREHVPPHFWAKRGP
jgi:hypothetical protein